MSRNRKNTINKVAAALMALLLMNSCNVTSDNPVDIPSGSEVDPAPYLGNWSLWSVAGEPPQQSVTVSIQQFGTNVIASYFDGMSSSTETVRLTRVNGEIIACLRGETGLWNISKVVLSADSNQMSVLDLNRERIKEDVNAGIIAGEVDGLDTNYYSVHITADSTAIRTYLLQATNAFYTNGMVFVR